MTFDQQEFDIRCEWGASGLAALAPSSDVIIIVDVLSFSTCVDIAVSRGARIFPCRWRDEAAHDYAVSKNAILAEVKRDHSRYSLSPESLLTIPEHTRLVLPSPNGATLTLSAGSKPVLTGCLRNVSAVARQASRYGRKIALIPAGERWKVAGGLRPAFEDWVGAGAIISQLTGSRSPEALAAQAAFQAVALDLQGSLRRCGSGKELLERGFEQDVILAADFDTSRSAPLLVEEAYVGIQA